MIKTVLTGFILGLILILAVPAILIMASWNAVPGDSTYSIKVGLEKAILGITPSDNLKTSLEIKYTERRFTEVEKLINTKGANTTNTKFIDESLTNLTNQAIASKNSLQKIQNSAEKNTQRETLITTLESISVKIEEKKQTSNPTSTSTKIPTKVPTKIPTKIPTNTPVVIKPNTISQPTIINKPSPTFTPVPTLIPTTIPTPTENNNPIINPPGLDETQEVIDEIIDELRGESSSQSNSDKDKNNDIRDNGSSSNRDKNGSDRNNQNKDNKHDSNRRP